jgi:hypothetical protein
MIHHDGDWAYESDRYGDWRATNEARGERTRLKRTLAAAQADVKAGRFQRRRAGEWEDRIEAFDRRKGRA